MSGTRKDGGAAFAALATSPMGDVHHRVGLSIRDWFAGQALIGLCQAEMGETEFIVPPELLARTAYAMADAMLAERERQP